MSNSQNSADNVISMEHLRRKRRRNRHNIKAVPVTPVRDQDSFEREERSAPSFDARKRPASSAASRAERPSREPRMADSTKVAAALAAGIVITALFLVAMVLLTGFFDVKEIELQGIEEENRQELLTRAGLHEGMNILGFSANAVKSRINADPSLAFVSIRREFPNRLILTVERRGAVCAIYHLGSYIKLDREYRVLGLEETDSSMGQYPVIRGVTVGLAQAGESLEFEDDLQEAAVRKVVEGLRSSNALQYIQQIHMTSLSEISMLADYDIHVDVGDAENMDIKANWISHMIPKLIEEGYRGGTLYVSGGRNASYSPEVKAPQETLPENLPSDSTIPEIEATPAPEGEE